jgi:hypothetical protein
VIDESSKFTRLTIAACLAVAAAGGILCVVIAGADWRAYARPLLLGFLACWLITMGSGGILALGNLTGGNWAYATRPYYMAAMNTLPFLVILFVIIAFNVNAIFPWTPSYTGEHEALSGSKADYLNLSFFYLRAISYHVIWVIVWFILGRVSRADLPPASTFPMRRAGAISLLLLIPTTTFAAFDWGMSLEPQWYSSIYGAILTGCGVVAAAALAIVALAGTATRTDVLRISTTDGSQETIQIDGVFNDLGNLLLSFIMLATYFAFSQFLIIWSGNLPSEISWYERRMSWGWGDLGLVVAGSFFAIPFLMLLSREGKRTAGYLRMVAVVVLLAYLANMIWMIVPAFEPLNAREIALFVCGLALIVGLWAALYFFHVGRLRSANTLTVE